MNSARQGVPSRFEASPDGSAWAFRGTLDFDNVVAVLEAADALPLPTSGRIDLHGIEKADSAALAMLFALLRRARAERHRIHFERFPPDLAALARVYGIEELLAGA